MLPKTIKCLPVILLALPPTSDPEKRGALWREESQAAQAAANGTDNRLRVAALSRLYYDFLESFGVLRNLAGAEQTQNTDAAARLQRTMPKWE